MGAMQRIAELRDRRRGKAKGAKPFDEEYAESSVSALHELLSVDVVDGQVRETATLTIFYEDGRLKWCLRDRDTSMTAWGSLESYEMGLETISTALDEDKCDWRKEKTAIRLDKHRRANAK